MNVYRYILHFRSLAFKVDTMYNLIKGKAHFHMICLLL